MLWIIIIIIGLAPLDPLLQYQTIFNGFYYLPNGKSYFLIYLDYDATKKELKISFTIWKWILTLSFEGTCQTCLPVY